MDELNKQVQRAQRRLNLQQFLQKVAWTMFAALLVAAIGVGIRKLLVIPVDEQVWLWSWLGGAIASSLFAAVLWTYVTRFRRLDAAIAIDQRFGLKERVSSSLALSEAELETPVGQALVRDASRRVEGIEVNERFGVQTRWWNLLPLFPAVMVFVLAVFVPDAKPTSDSKVGAATTDVKKQVKKSTENLKKKVAERRKKAQEAGLEEAGDLFDKLEQGVENLANKSDVDRKKAMIKLNDLAEDLKKYRADLGEKDALRKQLNQLSNLTQGPADRMAKAIKDGNFQKALDEIKNLQQKMRDGEMTDEERKALAEQLKQMADKLQQIADAHQQAKNDLKDEIERLKKAGNMAKAGELQEKLDQMNRQNAKMDRLRQMANKLGNCSKCMKQGQGAEAAENLGELAESLEEMQAEFDELEMLDEALDELAQAKDAMNCKKCGGDGCEFCQGMGFNDDMAGMGLGEGRGVGPRPEEETETGFFESQVRGKIGKGRAVVVGEAAGRNVAGNSIEEIKSELEAASADGVDPLTGQRLPKPQRTQAQQYFDSLREGGAE